MNRIAILILASLILSLSCALFSKTDPEKTAEQLIEEGMKHFYEEKYLKAIDAFRRLKDWYPFSKYATLAELNIADAYYNLKDYEEAALAYQSFERLHPKNEAIPHVVYRIGRCYFDRINAIDRDSSLVEKALEVFQRLKKEFPDSEFVEPAEEHIKVCRQNLAEREFYIGRFYFKSKHYKAALLRFQTIRQEYADIALKEDVKDYIARCERLIAAGAEVPAE